MLITPINGATTATFYPPQPAYIDTGYLEVSPVSDDAALAAKLQAEEFAGAATQTAGSLGPAVVVLEDADTTRQHPSFGSAMCYGLMGLLTLAWAVSAIMSPSMISAEQVMLDTNNQPTNNGTVIAQGIWFTESCPTSATWREAMQSLNPNEPNPVCTVTSSCDGIVAAEETSFTGCDVQRGNCIAVRAVSVALAALCLAGTVLSMGTVKSWCLGKLSRWSYYLAAILGFGLLIQYMVVMYTCGFTAGPGTESVAVLGSGYYNLMAASSWCMIAGLLVPGPSQLANARRYRTALFGMMLIALILVVSWI